ncbi:MAG: bifunctional folylpolyglutamate synthase/dihydrofolate synthase [Prevotellaceae bacterium]|nr:bifunctional folylpolyglutamate synthase/dihydrofolate synthase [Candidatus Minthosoma caballi]
MNYKETTEYLFNSTPLFQNVGQNAYKEGLYNTLALDAHSGHPHKKFKTVHVAGTNGKGSCSHTIAAILQASGLKVGLFTSPHLVDFRERIRVNGEMVSEEFVVEFVENNRDFFEPLYPSFFEITTAMAFKYFEEKEVDVAVVEVGLGGRLDCTNIITPEVCVITNISFDHVMFLGDTLAKIAGEKAGIIKRGIPVVIGEAVDETREVFMQKAQEENAPIIFAEESSNIINYKFNKNGGIDYNTNNYGLINAELGGFCQIKNTDTILHAIEELKKRGFCISNNAVKEGFAHVCEATGLMGRWQTINDRPKVVCDTGHNTGGFEWITKQLAMVTAGFKETESGLPKLRIVFGMVNDKDISGVLKMMPSDATYYFTQASVKRALPFDEIEEKAGQYSLRGKAYPTVGEAYEAALAESEGDDFIYVGGSSFVVADLLTYLNTKQN